MGRWVLAIVVLLVGGTIPALAQTEGDDGIIVYPRAHDRFHESALCVTDPRGERSAILKRFDRSRVDNPTWSPDNESLAFEWDGNISLMPADGSDVRVITSGRAPAWSPDGSQLAFERDGHVWSIDADGSDEVDLGAGRNPDWSPDGDRIVFDRAPEPVVTDGPEGELWVMDSDGSDDVEIGTGQEPAWSPDGRKLAYAIHTYWSSNLYVKDLEGEEGAALTQSEYSGYDQPRPHSPAWSPDGTRVVFSLAGLWVVNSDGSMPHRIVEQGGSPDWGQGPSDEGPLWDGEACADPANPTLSVSLRLRGHLFAHGKVSTNAAERCPVENAYVSVWKKTGGGTKLAGFDRADAEGRYSMAVKVRTGDGRLADRPGRYRAEVAMPPACDRARSPWKTHRH